MIESRPEISMAEVAEAIRLQYPGAKRRKVGSSLWTWRLRGQEVARIEIGEAGMVLFSQEPINGRQSLEKPASPDVIFVEGFMGLGDAIYQRPVIRSLARGGEVFLSTPWPFVYADIENVFAVRPETGLRTQAEHISRLPNEAWHSPPLYSRKISIRYGVYDLRAGMTPTTAFASHAGVEPMPAPMVSSAFSKATGIGLFRVPTVRREWQCEARNPIRGAIAEAVACRPDLAWIAIGHLAEEEEWLEDEIPSVSAIDLTHGEMDPRGIIELVKAADVIISSPCFLLPMAMALGAGPRMVCIFGGHIPPSALIEPLLGEPPNIVAPDPFCACFENRHECRKDLPAGAIRQAMREASRCRER